jgi:hypothetical protein
MSCKGIGGASETEPWLVQQPLEESRQKTSEPIVSKQPIKSIAPGPTFESKLPSSGARSYNSIQPVVSKQPIESFISHPGVGSFGSVVAEQLKVPIRTIGHYPKAESNSSLRVKGLQLLTSVAGLPLGKNQRRRTRARKRKIANYGSMDGAPVSQVKRLQLSQEFPYSQILQRIPMGDAKLRLLAKKNPGSWLAPKNNTQKQDFLWKANALALSADHIKCSQPIFYCGDDSGKIDGIPKDAIVRNVSSDLLVIDTVHGFKFPFSPSEQDDIILVRRAEALAHDNSDNHAQLLDSLKVLSNSTHNKGVVRGKKRIVAFQEGSNCKYLTPGICPLRAAPGTSVRALFDLDCHQHDALFRYVRKCEKLAMNSMSLQTTRGFNAAKQLFPFPTFPGRGNHSSSCHAFSSIATALNVCLNSHTDDDSFYGVVTNLDADTLKSPQVDDDVTLYFTFPTLGLAIALRPGDILVFNPAVYHSVSSRRDPKKNIWCTSLYTKNAVVGGNDNSRAIETVQIEAIDIARSMIQGCKKE